KVRKKAMAQQGKGEVPPPRTIPLGCLRVFSDGDERTIPVESEPARDFSVQPYHYAGEDGQTVHIGYRLSAGTWEGGDHMTRPVYLDERRLLFGTPNGFLQGVDLESGRATVVHDFNSVINGIHFHPEKRLLVVGCQDGTVTVFSA